MRISTSLIRGVALTAAVALAPSVANAAVGDMWLRNWTLCVQGTFSSCHSVQLKTTDMGTSTAVVVTVRNLNGQDQLNIDNSLWTGLSALRFYGAGIATSSLDAPSTAAPVVTMTTTGTANTGGQTTWSRLINSSGGTGLLRMNGINPPDGSNRRIGGCNPDPNNGPTRPTMFTCGGQIVFSFTANTLFNASVLNQAYMAVDIGLATGGSEFKDCQSGMATYTGSVWTSTTNQGTGECGIKNTTLTYLGNSSVPEPMTIALLGSGLIGIAGARRRKKTTEE